MIGTSARSLRTRAPITATLLAAWALTRAAALPVAITDLPLGDPARRDHQARVVLDAAVDTHSNAILGSAELVARLADTRILFIGEEHTDSEFHRVELRVIQALQASGREVLVGLEMFPYDQQGPLDDWTHDLLTEHGFVEKGDWYGNWSYPWGYYREIFEYARRQHIRLYGINLPRDVVATIRARGYDALSPVERSHLPPRIDLTSAEHRRLYRAYFDAGDALHHVAPDVEDAMYRVQVGWDAGMGWNAARALEAYGGPQAIMVVLIGAGHVAYGLGAQRQLEGQFVGKVSTLIPVAVRDTAFAPVTRVRASYADFVWGVPPQIRDDLPVLGVSLAGRIGANPTRVIQVEPGSAAALAGVEVGDVLLRLDDTPLDSVKALQWKMSDYHWSDEARLELRRDGRVITLPVVFRTDADAASEGK